MTPDDRIVRLEALLAQVRSRSRATPDPNRDAGPVNGVTRTTTPGLAAYVDATAVAGSSGWSDVPSAPNAWEVEAEPAQDANDERTIQEHPVVESFQAARGAMRPPEPSQTRVIDPQPMEVIELDIDPDPSMLPPGGEPSGEEPFESRSRLVAALAEPEMADVGNDEPPAIGREEGLDAAPGTTLDERIEGAEPRDLGFSELEELDEPAPSSSRRPISVEEKLKQLAEEDDSIHAAPPESGKLLAAPILNLDEPDVPGARRSHEERPTSVGGALVQVVGAAGAEVARATLEESDVAVFSGKAGEGRAATFGELLDATMKL